jgi:glycosyltransferase involved in cell wall biosynthesis
MQRVREMESRRGVYYTPKRLVPYPDLAQRSLEIADAASLIGNKETLATYPADLQAKIRLVTVSVPRMDEVIRRPPLLPAGREFLWFGGRGAVHKGLDLVLEAFADVPALALHVAGYVDQEPDFVKAYRRELFDTPNITYHGFMEIGSAAFAKILEKVFCFIAPSCSEGISPAAAVCLQVGLYPILSRHAGVTLPPGCGTYLEDCSVPEIQAAVRRLVLEPADRIESAMRSCQSYALSTYSREAFRRDYAAFLEDVLR